MAPTHSTTTTTRTEYSVAASVLNMVSKTDCAKNDTKPERGWRCYRNAAGGPSWLVVSVMLVLIISHLGFALYASVIFNKRIEDNSRSISKLQSHVNQLNGLLPHLRPKRSSGVKSFIEDDFIPAAHRKRPPFIGHVYRWVDPAPNDKRRHATTTEPSIEYIESPPSPAQINEPGYRWLTSNHRISLTQLESLCNATLQHCPLGPPGHQGAPGTPGAKGEKGEPGIDGLDGAAGLDGIPGMPGHGRDGRDGKPGLAGRNGTDGLPGAKGDKGDKGDAGLPGQVGPAGKKGPRGNDGKPGYSVSLVKEGEKYLVPPTIDGANNETVQFVTVKEGEALQLSCPASGIPPPLVTWQRGDNKSIPVDGTSHNLIEAVHLNISYVARDNMGLYKCVASNNIPPAASKRVELLVTFPPLVRMASIVGAPELAPATLECYVDAMPEPFVQWVDADNGTVIGNDTRHQVTEEVLERRLNIPIRRKVSLLIKNVMKDDYGAYKCVAKNNRGKTSGTTSLFVSDGKQQQQPPFDEFVVFGEVPKERQCPAAATATAVVDEATAERTAKVARPEYANGRDGCKPRITNAGYASLDLAKLKLKAFKRETQCYLSQIGKPVFIVDFAGDKVGAWMNDAKPTRPEDEPKYWMTRTQHDNKLLEEYSSKERLQARNATANHTLIHEFTGNAQVVYAGSFYYSKMPGELIRFNLKEHQTASLNLESIFRKDSTFSSSSSRLPPKSRAHPVRHNRSHRRRHPAYLYANGLNIMDILSDEHGLWLIYPHHNSGGGNTTLVIKLNVTANSTTLGLESITKIWNLTIDYHKYGEMFIICGVLYGIESSTEFNTHIAFAYDLHRDQELDLLEGIAFTNPFGSTEFVAYNARSQLLHTWDDGNILEYQLKIDTTPNLIRNAKEAALPTTTLDADQS